MGYMDKYKEWLEGNFDYEIKEELKSIKGNEKEIEDRFYKDLEFGTGGLRGKIGAGTNRINKYTVSKTTLGFGKYILDNGEENKNKGIVIAYDSRHKSEEFAKTAALVLANQGIKTYVFNDLRPTPELSFAVRHLNAAGGIVITASHNPPEYNGYKVYDQKGCQLVPRLAKKVISNIKDIEGFEDIDIMDEGKAKQLGLLNTIGTEVDLAFYSSVKRQSVSTDVDRDIKVVFTPLHGTGNIPVRRVLRDFGYTNIHVVREQEKPDAEFSTVGYPNPEDHKVFEIAEGIANNIKADLILGTDPDCDRVGAVVKNDDGEYIVLDGNQTGALLLDYILKNNNIPENGTVIKTIVTSELGRVIAEKHGLEVIDTLTGFKFIGEKISEFEETKEKNFVFGYEESFGYLKGTHARDKDAVVASMLIVEMAAFYRKRGMTLYEALKDLYERYGYFKETLHSIKLEGIEGKKKIDKVMNILRKDSFKEINGVKVNHIKDYNEEIDGLPKSNVIKFVLEDESWVVLRPSGTEPKLKIYLSTKGKNREKVNEDLKSMETEVVDKINNILE